VEIYSVTNLLLVVILVLLIVFLVRRL